MKESSTRDAADLFALFSDVQYLYYIRIAFLAVRVYFFLNYYNYYDIIFEVHKLRACVHREIAHIFEHKFAENKVKK